jgi:hypothetical protein
MKIHTQRSRPERGAGVVAALALLLAGCQATRHLGAEFRQHPAVLVGEWVDVAKSSVTDTALWVLAADGDDRSQHLRAPDSTKTGAPFVASEARHHGYWYLQGDLADTSGRALCFTKRPGRSAPGCVGFVLDSASTPGGVRPRLLVRGYQGQHHTGDRVLLKRGE